MALISLEIAVVAAGLGLLLLDLWTPREQKRSLGYVAAAVVALVLVFSFVPAYAGMVEPGSLPRTFGHGYVLDPLALFCKRFFLVAALIVLVLSAESAGQFETGVTEYYALVLFALAGMMLAASAIDFAMLFVSLELITVTFYILTSFLRSRVASLEAGVKYLILGALSSAFLVYGIALVYGSVGAMDFPTIAAKLGADRGLASQPVVLLGLVAILVGLGFKIAAVPFQVWAPDVYQGAPTPTAAFLAVGSKAAGFVLLLRLLFTAIPEITAAWARLLMALCALTILYGSLCAIPQRNLKRLLGYSSIANAGYVLLGVVAMTPAGSSAVLYYLAGYLFAVLGAFTVLGVVATKADFEDVGSLAGLHRRSPLLAAGMALSMISLAGVPPLAGFFGKFLLLKSVLEREAGPWLVAAALVGMVVSIYYYFGVIRAMYWPEESADLSPIAVSLPTRGALWVCIAGMLLLGLFPNWVLTVAERAAGALRL
jgi:NADH-quinone oxidoreductase subunit N